MESTPYLRLLRRRWWLAALVFAVTTASTLVFVARQPWFYSSKATFVVRPASGDIEDLVRTMATLSRSAAVISATYMNVANSELVRARAVDVLDVPDAEGLRVSSRVVTGTSMLEIEGEAPDPVLARDFTAAVGAETVAYVQGLNDAFSLQPLDSPDLQQQPAGPNKVLTGALGSIFGLVLGLALALLGQRPWRSDKDGQEPADVRDLAEVSDVTDVTEVAHVDDSNAYDRVFLALRLREEMSRTRRQTEVLNRAADDLEVALATSALQRSRARTAAPLVEVLTPDEAKAASALRTGSHHGNGHALADLDGDGRRKLSGRPGYGEDTPAHAGRNGKRDDR